MPHYDEKQNLWCTVPCPDSFNYVPFQISGLDHFVCLRKENIEMPEQIPEEIVTDGSGPCSEENYRGHCPEDAQCFFKYYSHFNRKTLDRPLNTPQGYIICQCQKEQELVSENDLIVCKSKY